MPIPNDSEKNACPSAETNTPAFSLLKSGLRKKSTPAEALGNDSDTPHNTNNITKSNGINVLDIFSIPPLTPFKSIKRLIANTTAIHIRGEATDCTESANVAANASFISDADAPAVMPA